MHHLGAVPGIEMQQHLRVGGRAEAHAFGLELPAQCRIVVDLAVEDDDKPPVVADHRLRGALGEIEDGKPAMSKAAAPIFTPPRARSIRPAFTHRLPRREQLSFGWRARRRVIGEDAVQTAHGSITIGAR